LSGSGGVAKHPRGGSTDKDGMLSHERLDVYQRSIEFLAAALLIAEKLPRGQAPLADQFRRAAMSIPLNIAEGSGRAPGSADRARFRGIARGSAMECGAILDVVRLLDVAPDAHSAQAKSLLTRIVEMLSKMS
jgi:four helix bundle protein